MSEAREERIDRLEKALREGAPELGLERIVDVERFTSGLSSQSYGIRAETKDGPTRWVARVEPEHGVIPPYDIAREHRLLEAVGRAGLPVPKALYLESDPTVFGGRFMLMSFVTGHIYRSMDPALGEKPELLKDVQRKFVEMLARVHDAPQDVFPIPDDPREATRAQIAVCRRRMTETELLPAPLLRHALDVLEARVPEPQKLALLHGDYRLPNLMWHDGEIAGILDWELATVGDPLSDLAFTQTVGAGHCSVENDLADHYSEITGVEIDPGKIAYYKLLELVKGSIIGLAGAYDLVNGGTDLRLLSVASIALSGQPVFAVFEAQMDSLLGEMS